MLFDDISKNTLLWLSEFVIVVLVTVFLRKRISIRSLEILIVVTSCIASLSIFIGAYRYINSVQFNDRLPSIIGSAAPMRIYLSSLGSSVCLPGRKSEISPSNFENVEMEKKALCEWYQKIDEIPENRELLELPKAMDMGLNISTLPKARFFEGQMDHIRQATELYMRSRNELLILKNRSMPGQLEYLFYSLIPIMVTFGLALSLGKALISSP
jgi:hypothetical protein